MVVVVIILNFILLKIIFSDLQYLASNHTVLLVDFESEVSHDSLDSSYTVFELSCHRLNLVRLVL